MNLLIDGYNLIFQCGLQGRRAGSLALEAARNRLISELTTRLPEDQRSTTTIVFDASDRSLKHAPEEQRVNGIRVMFAVTHDDADALIEELIRTHSAPKSLTVVSSDHRLHKAALRRKSTPIDSDVWFEQLETGVLRTGVLRPGNQPLEPRDSTEKHLPPELNKIDWEKEFGLDVASSDQGSQSPQPKPANPFPPGYGEDLVEDGEG